MAQTAPTRSKGTRLLTPPFRVSFPQVFEKASYNNGAPRFSVTGLFFPKATTGQQAVIWTPKDKERWKAIRARLGVVALEGFKKSYEELAKDRSFKLPFHKGDEKPYEGYGDPNMIYYTMANSRRRPQIVTLAREPITSANSDEFYAGCWARASVNPYWFNNIGKGLAIGLGNIKKLKDDKSFEGFTTADDDFGNDDEDFVDDTLDDDDFGVGGAGDDDDNDDPTA